jgi:hypothetical protein
MTNLLRLLEKDPRRMRELARRAAGKVSAPQRASARVARRKQEPRY